MQSPDRLDIVPEHVVDPITRAPWRIRLLMGFGDGVLSLLLNGAVVTGLIAVGWPLRSIQAPTAISVELVDHVPGETPDGAAPGAASKPVASDHESAEAKTAATAPKEEAPKDTAAAPQAEPVATEPRPERQHEAQMPPLTPAVEPAATVAAPNPVPPAEPKPQPAVPPPPEHPDNTSEPHLVEAPSAPSPAPTRPDPTPPPVAEATAMPEATPKTAETPAQRPVLTAPDGAETVARPAPPPEEPKPLTAEQKRQAANTATLAAMLPFGSAIAASPFQAPSTPQARGASEAYRGSVYANFNKAQDVIADAQAKHLKGQAVVAFTVDDHGGLASIGVAISSGNPAVDQAALELIRRGAPFPPPPPGAQRSFSPAIGIGLDQ